MADPKRPALGKGLSALIPDAPDQDAARALDIEIDRLAPNPHQPRLQMDEARLDELARSIAANGIIQPIVARRAGDAYHIIAGERRWRAARRAGLTRVPIVVRDVAAEESGKVLEMALVENLQRDDLNPIEEGLAYRRLAEEFHLTQDAIATAVGKDRSTVANMLRLLRLPQEVQDEVSGGRLSMGHARALLALENEGVQRQVGREIVARGLSVRETEAMVKKALEAPEATTPAKPAEAPGDVHTRAAEEKLRMQLGTRVRIVRRGKKGRIEIDFSSEDELIRLYDVLVGG